MTGTYEEWLNRVEKALHSVNMSIDDWQSVWPFDFPKEFEVGTKPDDAAMKANRFWWLQQNKQMGKDCRKVLGCWLPQNHHGECQPLYEPGDYIKVEFEGDNGMPGEWMWVIVESRDDKKRIVYGKLDNEPLNEYGSKLKVGSHLAISYDKVREYRKPTEFMKQ
jgi:hypothetical protein